MIQHLSATHTKDCKEMVRTWLPRLKIGGVAKYDFIAYM